MIDYKEEMKEVARTLIIEVFFHTIILLFGQR